MKKPFKYTLITNELSDREREEIAKKAEQFAYRNKTPDFKGFNTYLNFLLQLDNEIAFFTENEKGETVEVPGILQALIINGNKVTTEKMQIAQKSFYNKINELENAPEADPRGEYVQVFRDFHKGLEKRFTVSQRAKLMELMLCVEFDGKLLWNGKPMSSEEFAEYFGIATSTAEKYYLIPFTRKYEKKDGEKIPVEPVLLKYKERKKVKNKMELVTYYKFNPKGTVMGSVKDKQHFVKLFKKKLEDVIKRVKYHELKLERAGNNRSKKLDSSAIGVLHALLPYFHIKTFALVESDPLVLDIREGETIPQAVARELKVKRNKKYILMKNATIKRVVAKNITIREDLMELHLETLTKAGALKQTTSFEARKITVHPHLLFFNSTDGTDEFTQSIVTEFGELEQLSEIEKKYQKLLDKKEK